MELLYIVSVFWHLMWLSRLVMCDRCMDTVMATQPQWGLLRFGRDLDDGTPRDWFMAIRTDMTRSVQYDTFIPVYKSDCDYFPRVQHQGWTVADYAQSCGELAIKVTCAVAQLC
jgi:hypothetical protein